MERPSPSHIEMRAIPGHALQAHHQSICRGQGRKGQERHGKQRHGREAMSRKLRWHEKLQA